MKRFVFLCALAACVPPAPQARQPQQVAMGPAAAPAAAARNVRFNGVVLDARGAGVLAQLEAQYQTRLPDGDYWYDPMNGASGTWGGPAAVILPAGLPLGGVLRPDASGGGQGRTTGVFVNGRELHPLDVQALMRFTAVYPGRYWVDAQGNGGLEGGPPLFNLYALARAKGGRSTSMSDANGSIWTGGGAFNSSWKSDGGATNSTCSYDPSDGAGVMCSKTDR